MNCPPLPQIGQEFVLLPLSMTLRPGEPLVHPGLKLLPLRLCLRKPLFPLRLRLRKPLFPLRLRLGKPLVHPEPKLLPLRLRFRKPLPYLALNVGVSRVSPVEPRDDSGHHRGPGRHYRCSGRHHCYRRRSVHFHPLGCLSEQARAAAAFPQALVTESSPGRRVPSIARGASANGTKRSLRSRDPAPSCQNGRLGVWRIRFSCQIGRAGPAGSPEPAKMAGLTRGRPLATAGTPAATAGIAGTSIAVGGWTAQASGRWLAPSGGRPVPRPARDTPQ